VSHKRERTLLEAPTGKLISYYKDIKEEIVDSWSLSHLVYLYPETTPETTRRVVKLDHNRSCLWVYIAQVTKAPTINCAHVTVGRMWCVEAVGDHHGQETGLKYAKSGPSAQDRYCAKDSGGGAKKRRRNEE